MKIGDLFVKLGLKKDEFDKGIGEAKSQTSAFASGVKKIGGLIAGAFAADRIISFGKELFSIGQKAEGIQTAFYKIATASDLNNLKKSVKGTVSELELMQRAVQANNFSIPVQTLGKLFEFATKRAQDTGQSVDYLVDSIVLGIGRKSPLILDNLGISAIQLKEKLNGVGLETASVGDIAAAVGQIADESFKKTGDIIDTLGIKSQRLGANWDNLKTKLSGLFSDSDMLKQDLDDWSNLIEIWQSNEVTKWEKFLASFSGVQAKKIFDKLKLDQYVNEFLNIPESESTGGPLSNKIKKQIITIKSLEEENKNLSESLKDLDIEDKKGIKNTLDKIAANEKLIKSVKEEHKTSAQKLADLKAINDELEAQRILSQEFKGEKISPIQGKFTNTAPGDLQLGLKSSETAGIFGNLDSHYDMTLKKNKQFTKEYLEQWVDFTDELNSSITNGIADAIGSLTEGLTQLATGEISGGEFGQGILKVIGQFMQTLGGLFIAYAINAALFAESAKNPLAWPLALAAGIGLIAAGAAITSFAGKGLSGGSSSSISSSSSNYRQSNAVAAISGNVVFELDGYKLKGALNNADRRNTLIR